MARVPHGTTLTWNGVVVAEIVSIDGPETKLDETETTSHDSNWWREYLPTLLEGGEISMSANYVPSDAGQAKLRTDMRNRTVAPWSIEYPDGYGFSGNGFITSFAPTGPSDDKSEVSIAIRTTGEITDLEPAS